MDLESALKHGAALWILGDLRYATPTGEGDIGALRGRQPQTVLARLAASPHVPVPCTELAATVWRMRWPATWETTLRSVVSRLRSELLSTGWPSANPIRFTLDAYVLAVDGPLWLDAAFARRVVSTAEIALADARFAEAATAGEAGWQLAQRSPVLSVDTRFGARLARSMTQTAHRAAVVTARAWLGAGDPDFAMHFARGAVEIAPYREDGWRLLLEAHGHRDDTAAVAATFDEMTTAFEADLGMSPHPETFTLYRRLTAAGRSAWRTSAAAAATRRRA